MTLEVTIRADLQGYTYILDRVEFVASAGNVLVSCHESSQLLWPFRHISEAKLELLQKPMNFWAAPASTEFGTHGTYRFLSSQQGLVIQRGQ